MDIWIDVLNRAAIFGVAAISLNLVVGYLGLLSLAHAAFFGIGAYTSAILTLAYGWPFVPAALAAVGAGAVAGLVVAALTARLSGEFLVLMTLALLSLFNQVVRSWVDVTGGATGLFTLDPPNIAGWSPDSIAGYLWFNGGLLALTLVVFLVIGESPFGRVLKGVREDAVAARAHGKRTSSFVIRAFIVSAAFGALAGVAWSHYLRIVSPSSFTLDTTILIAAMVVLGGLANSYGSLLAAVILVVLPEVFNEIDLGDNSAPLRNVLYGVALVLLVRYRPTGMLAEARHTGSLLWPSRRSGRGPGRRDEEGGSGPAPAGGEALTVEHVSKSFGGVKALDDVSITVGRGGITGLIGPNGAGKSTLFNVLTGELRPDSGAMRLHGEPVGPITPARAIDLGLGRTFQDGRLFKNMSVLDNVALAVGDQPGESMWRLFCTPRLVARTEGSVRRRALIELSRVGLHDQADRPMNELAFGDQKLAALSRTLATGARLLLLDEPLAGTDPRNVQAVLDILLQLGEEGYSICLIEHNLDVMRRLEGRIFYLHAGRIVGEGSVEQLMSEEGLAREYLGGRRGA